MIEELATVARAAMTDWGVPGAGVAIVTPTETQVIGVGVRDVTNGLEISGETVFPIGSVTKSYTAALAATLAEQAVVDLDVPIIEYVPAIRLWDATAREQVTLRDLLCHRTGLPRHDLVWYGNDPARDLIAVLRHLAPSAGFRARWQYQNLMYALAGHVLEEAAGDPWATLLEHHVLRPGGLGDTAIAPRGTMVTLYGGDGGSLQEITPHDLSNIAPAGGLHASLADLARWAELQVRDDGRLGSATKRAVHAMQIVVPVPSLDPEIAHPGYGLGWFVDHYRGRLRVHHPGNIDGCSTRIAAVPEAGVAVVATCNRHSSPVPEVIVRTALDQLLGLATIDWHARFLARRSSTDPSGESTPRTRSARRPDAPPTHEPPELIGTYAHPAYGHFAVTIDNDELVGQLGCWRTRLAPWHYDTVELALPGLEARTALATFRRNARGDFDQVAIPLEPAVDDIVFGRVPVVLEPEVLRRFTGCYAVAARPQAVLTIELSGGALAAAMPGQARFRLVPYRSASFDLDGLAGYSISFAADTRRAILHQPDGDHELVRLDPCPSAATRG